MEDKICILKASIDSYHIEVYNCGTFVELQEAGTMRQTMTSQDIEIGPFPK